ncbi:Insecticidal toxin complex protein tccz [Enterobacter chuandaensis]|uniref:Insecticidal toxin complex protein tccz n=1 Tax=Enterobacter chuandaensis TaxID=2497875 RepID=UPI0039C2F7AD
MINKIGALFFLMLFTATAQAEKGSFELSIGAEKYIFQPSCIKSLEYNQQDKTDSEYLSFHLTDICGKRMEKITTENMAQQMRISYRGNSLFSAMITQILSSNFRFTTEDTSKVVIMQIIMDYNALVK